MKTYNLAQALKQKNRLAGEVACGREIVQRENSRKKSQPTQNTSLKVQTFVACCTLRSLWAGVPIILSVLR